MQGIGDGDLMGYYETLADMASSSLVEYQESERSNEDFRVAVLEMEHTKIRVLATIAQNIEIMDRNS